MEQLTLKIPTLYGDHHTIAVRKILEGLEGVEDMWVSSAFYEARVTYDPKVTSPEKIIAALSEQGYEPGEELPAFPLGVRKEPARRTAMFEGIGDAMAFPEANLAFEGRPLWPCPGLQPLKMPD